jgi:hypothetical protein
MTFEWKDGAYYNAKPTCMGWTETKNKHALQFAIEVAVEINEPGKSVETLPMTRFYNVNTTEKISMDILYDAVRACGIDPTKTKSREWATAFNPDAEVRIKVEADEYEGKVTWKVTGIYPRKGSGPPGFLIRSQEVSAGNQQQLASMQDTLDSLFQSGQQWGRDTSGAVGGAAAGGSMPVGTPKTPRQQRQEQGGKGGGGGGSGGPPPDDDSIPF